MEITPDTVRGLTLWQPWAQLVALAVKRIETRCWGTAWRGLVFIHASQMTSGPRRREIADSPAWRHLRAAGDPRGYVELEHGAVLAVARVADCRGVADPVAVSQVERDCGDLSLGRFAWFLEDLVRLERPVACRGGQRLWIPTPELCARVRAAMPRAALVAHAGVDELADRIAP